MAVNKLLIVIYLIGCIHHTFVGVYSLVGLDFSGIHDERLLDMKVNSYRYLTTWNLAAQTIYFYFALIIEILGGFEDRHKQVDNLINICKVTKGWFFSGIIFPSTFSVTTLFWTLNLLNKEYVLPPNYERVLPQWMNHCIHSNIVYLPIVEIAFGQLYLPRHFVTFPIAILYPIIYIVQYMLFYRETGRWLYGVMYYMDSVQQIFFILFTLVYFVFLAFIGVLLVKRKKNLFVLSREAKGCLFVRKLL